MTTDWPRCRTPPNSVPVTTVPAPGNVKTRSTVSLGLPISRGGGVSDSTRASVALSSAIPRPLTTEVGTIGASAKGLSSNRSRMAATAPASSDVRSALVSVTTARRTPK